jgi:precorrin-6B C5,15-methyltransferase / cobalt-precorrin-6B C5,C15-methyltransferase
LSSKKGHLTVISCGIGSESLTDIIRTTVAGTAILAGAQRLLDLFPDFAGEKIIIGKCAGTTIANIANLVLEQEKNVCVLASGDSLFHGIGKTFAQFIPADQMMIIPNITAMQSLVAKLCIPWDSAKFFSIHGHKNHIIPWRAILAANTAVIYCDPKCTAADIADFLIRKIPEAADHPAAIGSDLGLPTEKVIQGTLREMAAKNCSGLSILVVLSWDSYSKEGVSTDNDCVTKAVKPGLAFGLPDSAFSHKKNLITHSEVRAVALSKLHLGAGVIWDIGAGSGSVGIEAAGLCNDLTVYSVEKNRDRVKDIEFNIKEFGLSNIVVKQNEAQEIIEDLPAPRAVFIGGGGEGIASILKSCYDKLLPNGYIVATAVLLETRSALAETLKDKCIEVVSLSVSRSKELGKSRMMKTENSIEMFVYKKDL